MGPMADQVLECVLLGHTGEPQDGRVGRMSEESEGMAEGREGLSRWGGPRGHGERSLLLHFFAAEHGGVRWTSPPRRPGDQAQAMVMLPLTPLGKKPGAQGGEPAVIAGWAAGTQRSSGETLGLVWVLTALCGASQVHNLEHALGAAGEGHTVGVGRRQLTQAKVLGGGGMQGAVGRRAAETAAVDAR